jgi:hypothetical protein
MTAPSPQTNTKFDFVDIVNDLTVGGTIHGGGIGGSTKSVVGFFDGGGSALTAPRTTFVTIPYSGTIAGWTIIADTSGSAVVDVWKVPFSGVPASSGNSIAGTDLPTLSSAIKAHDLTLSGWGSTAITAGDVLYFHLNSASTVTQVSVVLTVSA